MPAEADFDSYLAFATGAGSAQMTQADWQDYFSHLLLDGVLAGVPSGTTPVSTELQPYADSTGLQVKVRAGRALIDGHLGRSTSEKTLSIATADATNPRFDIVVARLDRTSSKVTLAVVTGTPAVSPSVPALTDNSATREILLGLVAVAAAAVTIAAGNVTDRRRFAVPDARGLPTIRVIRSSVQEIDTGSSGEAIEWMTASRNTGAFWVSTSSPTRLYLRRTGLYAGLVNVRFASNATGYRELIVRANGTTAVASDRRAPLSGAETIMAMPWEYVCTAADQYVELVAVQTSGSGLNAEVADYAPQMTASLVRPG